jgi:hypothetical protein
MTTVAVKLRPICGRTPSRVAASSYPGRRADRGPFHCISACSAFSEVATTGDLVSVSPEVERTAARRVGDAAIVRPSWRMAERSPLIASSSRHGTSPTRSTGPSSYRPPGSIPCRPAPDAPSFASASHRCGADLALIVDNLIARRNHQQRQERGRDHTTDHRHAERRAELRAFPGRTPPGRRRSARTSS